MDEMFQKRDIVTHAIESGVGLGGPQATERRCQITVLNGACTGLVVEIEKSPFRVGKGKDNNVNLPDPTVSREHFNLSQEGGTFLIRDLGSTNGTWIDGMRIREAYLRPGALIRAGDVELRFEPLFKPVEVAPSESHTFGSLVGRSIAMRQIFSLLNRVSSTDATVIILGETGTGKGAVARAIHQSSPRRDKPFVVVDCGAIAENLIESELFGHERGAFTGATSSRQGAMELAGEGTLFIDELVDLRLDLQPKLLRALEEREFRRLGSNKGLKLDARIIAATKRDLWAEVEAGNFREDLYFRLAVFTIPLPPLRDRIEDIPLLVECFSADLATTDSAKARIGPELFSRLQAHKWPGNVRELRNALERFLCFGGDHVDPLLGPLTSSSRGNSVQAAPSVTRNGVLESAPATPQPGAPQSGTPQPAVPQPGVPQPKVGVEPTQPLPGTGDRLAVDYDQPFKVAKERLLERFEVEYLRRLLSRCRGQISQAAREAGIDRKHLYNLMRKYRIEPGSTKSS